MDILDLWGYLHLDNSDYVNKLNDSEGAASSLAGVAGKVGATIAKGVAVATGAVTAFAGASVKTGMEFDSSMSQVSAVLGQKSEEIIQYNGENMKAIDALRDFAQETGRTTMYTASESAQALKYMALAGYNATESMEMLPNVLTLAAAGGMDLARASDMVTDAQTALGIQFEDMPTLINEMVKAQSTGNTSLEQMGDAILTIGGLAKELNSGYVTMADGSQVAASGVEELQIALVAMANSGIKGSEAGTHLRNMLLKLTDPTDDGAEMMEALGVSVFDAAGNMQPLSAILRDLSGAMGELTQEDRLNVISELFNTRDMASAEALLTAINSDWDTIGASILDAGGAAQEASDKMMDNLGGALKYFESAMEGVKIAISDKLTPTLTEFVKLGTEALSKFTDAFKEKGLQGAIEVLPEILNQGIELVFQFLPQALQAGVALLNALVNGIITNLPALIPAVFEIITTITDSILENMPMLMESAQNIILGIVNGISENIGPVLDSAVEILFTLGEGLINSLPELIPAVVEIILTIVEKLTDPDTLTKMIEVAFTLIGKIAEGLIDAIPVLVEKVPTIILNLVEYFLRFLPEMLTLGTKLIIQLAAGLIAGVAKVTEAVVKVFASIKDGFQQRIKDAVQWGKDLISNFVQGIKDSFGKVKDAFTSLGDLVKSYIHFSEPDVGPLSDFHTYAPDMIKTFAEGIKANEGLIKDQIAKSFDFLNAIPSPATGGIIGTMGGGRSEPKQLTVILELDRQMFGKVVYMLNNEETQRVGVKLAGGYGK